MPSFFFLKSNTNKKPFLNPVPCQLLFHSPVSLCSKVFQMNRLQFFLSRYPLNVFWSGFWTFPFWAYKKLLPKSPIAHRLFNSIVNSQSSACLIHQHLTQLIIPSSWIPFLHLTFKMLHSWFSSFLRFFSVSFANFSSPECLHNGVPQGSQFLNPLLCLHRLPMYPDSLGDLN